MTYRVIIQPIAFQEIEAAYRWMCDNISADVADQWYYALEAAIASLEEFPNRCAVAPESAAIGREIRQFWIGKRKQYRILFVVESDVVAILHVRHRRQAQLESSDF